MRGGTGSWALSWPVTKSDSSARRCRLREAGPRAHLPCVTADGSCDGCVVGDRRLVLNWLLAGPLGTDGSREDPDFSEAAGVGQDACNHGVGAPTAGVPAPPAPALKEDGRTPTGRAPHSSATRETSARLPGGLVPCPSTQTFLPPGRFSGCTRILERPPPPARMRIARAGPWEAHENLEGHWAGAECDEGLLYVWFPLPP